MDDGQLRPRGERRRALRAERAASGPLPVTDPSAPLPRRDRAALRRPSPLDPPVDTGQWPSAEPPAPRGTAAEPVRAPEPPLLRPRVRGGVPAPWDGTFDVAPSALEALGAWTVQDAEVPYQPIRADGSAPTATAPWREAAAEPAWRPTPLPSLPGTTGVPVVLPTALARAAAPAPAPAAAAPPLPSTAAFTALDDPFDAPASATRLPAPAAAAPTAVVGGAGRGAAAATRVVEAPTRRQLRTGGTEVVPAAAEAPSRRRGSDRPAGRPPGSAPSGAGPRAGRTAAPARRPWYRRRALGMPVLPAAVVAAVAAATVLGLLVTRPASLHAVLSAASAIPSAPAAGSDASTSGARVPATSSGRSTTAPGTATRPRAAATPTASSSATRPGSTTAAPARTPAAATSPASAASSAPAAAAAGTAAGAAARGKTAAGTGAGDVTYVGFGTAASTTVALGTATGTTVRTDLGARFTLPQKGSASWAGASVSVSANTDSGTVGCRILGADGSVLDEDSTPASEGQAVCAVGNPPGGG